MAQVWLDWHLSIVARHRAEAQRRAAQPPPELPFVTVVMTHYNRPDLCTQALESLEKQDYPQDRFEVILVDDGSTQPEAVTFLQRTAEIFKTKNWTLLNDGVNRYLGGARNFAFKHAKGKYVARHATEMFRGRRSGSALSPPGLSQVCAVHG